MILSHKKTIAPYWKVIINSGLLVICIILLVSIGELFHGLRLSRERLGYVSDTYKQARDQNNDLTQEYRDLTTPDGIEYYVRNHYRAVSSDEELIVVVDPSDIITVPQSPKIPFMEQVRIFLHIP